MQKDDAVLVGHMLDMSVKAIDKLENLGRDAYDTDENLRLALAHLVQTIGEAARSVSAAYQHAHPEIPWSQVIGIRHKIVHDYLHVDYDIVWGVVKQDLPSPAEELRPLVP